MIKFITDIFTVFPSQIRNLLQLSVIIVKISIMNTIFIKKLILLNAIFFNETNHFFNWSKFVILHNFFFKLNNSSMCFGKPFSSEKLLWINQNNIYLNRKNHLCREFVQSKLIIFKNQILIWSLKNAGKQAFN